MVVGMAICCIIFIIIWFFTDEDNDTHRDVERHLGGGGGIGCTFVMAIIALLMAFG